MSTGVVIAKPAATKRKHRAATRSRRGRPAKYLEFWRMLSEGRKMADMGDAGWRVRLTAFLKNGIDDPKSGSRLAGTGTDNTISRDGTSFRGSLTGEKYYRSKPPGSISFSDSLTEEKTPQEETNRQKSSDVINLKINDFERREDNAGESVRSGMKTEAAHTDTIDSMNDTESAFEARRMMIKNLINRAYSKANYSYAAFCNSGRCCPFYSFARSDANNFAPTDPVASNLHTANPDLNTLANPSATNHNATIFDATTSRATNPAEMSGARAEYTESVSTSLMRRITPVTAPDRKVDAVARRPTRRSTTWTRNETSNGAGAAPEKRAVNSAIKSEKIKRKSSLRIFKLKFSNRLRFIFGGNKNISNVRKRTRATVHPPQTEPLDLSLPRKLVHPTADGGPIAEEPLDLSKYSNIINNLRAEYIL